MPRPVVFRFLRVASYLAVIAATLSGAEPAGSSWDRVPLYVHFGKRDGDLTPALETTGTNALSLAGGSIKDVVTITVYLTDPRLIDPLMPLRREFWPEGNFPASTTITVHSLPAVGMMLEISAVAVVGDK